MLAMSRWSNSVSCKAPLFSSSLIAGARSAVIQSRPADFDVLGDARLGDHAAVADQHHMAEAEALLELVDLRRQRHRIAGVAVEHLDGDRATVRGAEQAVDDLQRALLAVTAVATFGQRTAASLHVARRDVVEHQCAVAEMASGQRGLDGRLARQQPVERGVQFVVIDLAETEHFTEAGGAVAGDSVRAAASLETGSRMRPISSARTRSRQRLPSGPRSRSRPILRAVPSAAAT